MRVPAASGGKVQRVHDEIPAAQLDPQQFWILVLRFAIVFAPAAGDARYSAPIAMSHFLPIRPSGISAAAAASFASSELPGISLDMPGKAQRLSNILNNDGCAAGGATLCSLA